MKYLLIVFIIYCSCACKQETKKKVKGQDSIVVVNKRAVIPKERDNVSRSPVEVYSRPITGSALQGEFGVRLYETKNTFHYLMKIRYAEMVVTDTLRLPDMGDEPAPKIRAAAEPNACIVGFLDENKIFKEYKLVRVKNDKLSIKALKHYAVATYKVSE